MDPVTTPPAAGTTAAPIAELVAARIESTTPAKPGYKTTEFYLSTFATIVGAAISVGLVPTTGPWPKISALVVCLLSSLGYTVTRGMVKANSVFLCCLCGALLLSGCSTAAQERIASDTAIAADVLDVVGDVAGDVAVAAPGTKVGTGAAAVAVGSDVASDLCDVVSDVASNHAAAGASPH